MPFETAGDGRTDRLGRLLAPMAIRYVVVPVRSAPAASNGAELPVPDTLISSLGSQLDLRKVDIDDALYVYENTAWIPEPRDPFARRGRGQCGVRPRRPRRHRSGNVDAGPAG